jgi:soluble lytic murein transglycosylase-like protein
MPLTAKRFDLENPHDPEAAVDAAARYLRKLQVKFEHRLDLILAAYNAGEETVAAYRDGRRLLLSNGKIINPNAVKTGGVPPYRETRGYVNDGIALYLRLAERKDDQPKAFTAARLNVPKQMPQTEPAESLPQEITQLKQGSIYILESEDPQNTPALQTSSRSIYPQ